MGLVRGRDTQVGVEIALEGSTYGTIGGTSTWVPIPIIDSDLDLTREQAPDSDEISALSARQDVETGRALAVGSITVRPRYDALYWNLLCALSTGHENVVQDKWIDGQTDTTGVNQVQTHIYSINDTLPVGCHIRVYISGPTNTGSIKLFTGAMVSKVTFSQDSTNGLRATFEFLCKSMTLIDASVANIGTPGGSVVCKLRDLARRTGTQFDSRTEFRSDASGAYTHVKMHNWTVEIDRSMEVNEAIMSSPDDIEKPGVTAQREVFVSMDGPYDALSAASRHPYHDYVNNVESGFNVVFCSATALTGAATGMVYAMKINVPRITYTEGSLPVTDGNVLKWSVKGTAVQGAIAYYPDRLTPGSGEDHAIPASGTDVRILTCVEDGDLGAAGRKFTYDASSDGATAMADAS